MSETQFKFVSLGTVAENKSLTSKQIKVTPIEVLTKIDGGLKSEPVATESSGVDSQGREYQTKQVSDNVWTATWNPGVATNRRTAPNVRRGERVEIWQGADEDKYYWRTMGDDDHLRKLETVIWTFSDTQDEAKDSTLPGNCYFLELSTHKKVVTFQTAKENGEPYMHTIQIDTATGVFSYQDDVGNYIEVDSAETLIALKNALGTYLFLDKQHIRGYAPATIHMEAKQSITHQCGSTSIVQTPGTVVITTPSMDINQA